MLQASSAHQAIQVLQGPQGIGINLVLTDQHMPDGNGWDLLNCCRQHVPMLPVVRLSAAPASRVRPDTQKHTPFDAQLLKPVRSDELLQVIGRLPKLQYFEPNMPLETVNTAHTAIELVANEINSGALSELRQLAFEGRGLEVDAWLVRHGASLAPSVLREILPLAATLQLARMLELLPLEGQ